MGPSSGQHRARASARAASLLGNSRQGVGALLRRFARSTTTLSRGRSFLFAEPRRLVGGSRRLLLYYRLAHIGQRADRRRSRSPRLRSRPTAPAAGRPPAAGAPPLTAEGQAL